MLYGSNTKQECSVVMLYANDIPNK